MNARVLTLLALVAAAILGFLAYYLRPDRGESLGVSPAVEVAEAPPVEAEPTLLAAEVDQRKEVPSEPEPDPELPEVSSTEAPVLEKPDLEAKTSIQIRTLDPDGLPIEGVTVSIWAMRSQRDPGAHYLYRGEGPTAVTDHRGIATLDHWVWVDLDGKTGQVTLSATHADFTPFQGDVEIGPGVRDIVLAWGATVVVSGWYGERSRRVRDIEVQVDRDARLPATAWTGPGAPRPASTASSRRRSSRTAPSPSRPSRPGRSSSSPSAGGGSPRTSTTTRPPSPCPRG